MSTDPKKPHDDGSERRPSGAESKDGTHGEPGGHRSKAGSDYGDWVPDRGQPTRNDDRDATPGMGGYVSGGGDLMNVGRQPGSAQPTEDAQHAGTTRTGVLGEQERLDEAEAKAESNRNKDFDTTHVHSSTTSRKV